MKLRKKKKRSAIPKAESKGFDQQINTLNPCAITGASKRSLLIEPFVNFYKKLFGQPLSCQSRFYLEYHIP